MEDAAGRAVDDGVGERPGAAQRERCPGAVAAAYQHEAEHGKRQEPGELAGEGGLGETQRSDGY